MLNYCFSIAAGQKCIERIYLFSTAEFSKESIVGEESWYYRVDYRQSPDDAKWKVLSGQEFIDNNFDAACFWCQLFVTQRVCRYPGVEKLSIKGRWRKRQELGTFSVKREAIKGVSMPGNLTCNFLLFLLEKSSTSQFLPHQLDFILHYSIRMSSN